MSKLPVVNKGVTLAEIHGEISVFFEIGNIHDNPELLEVKK